MKQPVQLSPVETAPAVLSHIIIINCTKSDPTTPPDFPEVQGETGEPSPSVCPSEDW